MKITVRELIDAQPALNKIFSSEQDLNQVLSLAKIKKIIDPEMLKINKEFNQIVKKYAILDDNGDVKIENGVMNFKDKESTKLANDELLVLNNKEISLSISKISMESLVNIKLSAVQLLILEKFIESKDV